MLRSLQFKNFKSWESLSIKTAPITGFFGSNSSGKTSIIEFLLLLKQTKENLDRTIALDFGGEESVVNLQNFETAVYQHDLSNTISWRVDWKMEETLSISDPDGKRSEGKFRGTDMAVSSAVRIRNNAPFSTLLKYEFSGAHFLLNHGDKKETEFHLDYKDSDKDRKFKFTRTQGRNWSLPGPVKSYAFPDQARTYYQNSGFLGFLELEYEKFLEGIYHLGPLREPPKRQYFWSKTRPVDVGEKGEKTIEAILSAVESNERQNIKKKGRTKNFDELIAYWLKELGLIHSFEVKEIAKKTGIYHTVIKKTANSSPTTIVDVGFGVSQVLPVLVLLHYVPEGSTVILEQPEIHLHPAVQSKLADVLINVALHRNIQVIVESHSEHMLRRLQRRIAEEKISETDVILYFCTLPKNKSNIEELKLNLFGEIENWPEDFFGNELEEIAATQKAALKRRIRLNSSD